MVQHRSYTKILKGVKGDLTFCPSNFARFLEHFILNGPDPNALDAVVAQLNDPNRQNPQELDRAVGEITCVFKASLVMKFKKTIDRYLLATSF